MLLLADSIASPFRVFDPSGARCVWAPGIPIPLDGDAKLALGVRSYPCVERAGWLWVWRGQPDLADPAQVPMPEIDMKPDCMVFGYKMNPSHYMMLIEKLLDLSHLHFLYLAHALTPLDYRNTHQFFMMSTSSPFVIDTAEVVRIIQEVVFEQDVEVVREMQATVDADVRPRRVEFNWNVSTSRVS